MSEDTARTILVAGTASHVGKSTVAAGLCRLLSDRDVDVAPFKAQNMSNNARAVPGGEIGISQYVQARAARTQPTTDHNPVLLKPRGDSESQLVLDGEAVGHYEAGAYYENHWEQALETARAAYERLAQTHDVIVAEGAGALAEPNLRERDLANIETARFADAEILLVVDIERGGAFASLVGTLELVPADLRERIEGALITKFRGDEALLDPAVEELERDYDLPVLGVIPHDDPGLPAEDSVSLPPVGERATEGGDDGVPDSEAVTIGVVRLPRISNFTDLGPLAREPGVRVAYLPLDASLSGVDALVLPGTKNTVDDLRALHDEGMVERIRAFDGPVVGLCGGYQMLGERITNADIESIDEVETVEGIGLLPVETAFESEKQVEPVTRQLSGVGPLAGTATTVEGYEIHMGRTHLLEDVPRPFEDEGAARGDVLGTYLHGLFENSEPRRAFCETVFEAAGLESPTDERTDRSPYDRAAALLAEHATLDPVL